MDNITKEQILQAIDEIQSTENKEVTLIATSKSMFKIFKETFSGTNVMLVQNKILKSDTVYIIPTEKPIKII
jgi:hypothetical protein